MTASSTVRATHNNTAISSIATLLLILCLRSYDYIMHCIGYYDLAVRTIVPGSPLTPASILQRNAITAIPAGATASWPTGLLNL